MRQGIRQIWQACTYNFHTWRRNPRIWVVFGLGFVLCFLLTNKVVRFSQEYHSILQLFEPFIWTFGDTNSILLASLLLVLLFSNMPFVTAATPFYLARTTRFRWLLGQLLYIIMATGIYLLFILVCSSLLCAQQAYLPNFWSPAAAILGYSKAGTELQVPSMVKCLEMASPLSCMGMIFALILLYTLLCIFLMFVCNLRFGRFWGIFSVFAWSLYGFFLNPQIFVKILHITDEHNLYVANVAAAWASPLNHATFSMHSFGYELLPTLGQSCLCFAGCLLLLWILGWRAVRRYNFGFSGG